MIKPKQLVLLVVFLFSLMSSSSSMANVSELFVKLNTLAFYTNSTLIDHSDTGFYSNCLLKMGANGRTGAYKFVHCEWVDLRFIQDEPVYSAQNLQVYTWIRLLESHAFNLRIVRNTSLKNAADYLQHLTLTDFQKNHVERMLYDYNTVPYAYCEITDWSNAKKSVLNMPKAVQKLILTVIKRVTFESKTDIQHYVAFVARYGLEKLDETIDLTIDEYDLALQELKALN